MSREHYKYVGRGDQRGKLSHDRHERECTDQNPDLRDQTSKKKQQKEGNRKCKQMLSRHELRIQVIRLHTRENKTWKLKSGDRKHG